MWVSIHTSLYMYTHIVADTKQESLVPVQAPPAVILTVSGPLAAALHGSFQSAMASEPGMHRHIMENTCTCVHVYIYIYLGVHFMHM